MDFTDEDLKLMEEATETLYKLKRTIRRADCDVDEALEACKEFIKWHIEDINKFFA